MEMTLRWYGSKFDTVTLEQIRQIPGVTGVITTLYDTAPGEVWSRERIAALKAEVAAAGLHISGIERRQRPRRHQNRQHRTVISTLITTLRHWKISEKKISISYAITSCLFSTGPARNSARKRPDGSTVLAYTQEAVDALDPEKMFESIAGDTNGSIMPGWEPERMAHIKELFAMYKDIDR